jgi:hypothetical protein
VSLTQAMASHYGHKPYASGYRWSTERWPVDTATTSHAIIMPGMLNDQFNDSADLALNRDATSGR